MKIIILWAIFAIAIILLTFCFVGYFGNYMIPPAILLAVIFANYDFIGHHILLTRGGTEYQPPQELVYAYRTNQIQFQIFLTSTALLIDWQWAAGLTILWLFGVCDMLYYLFGLQDFTKQKNMAWLWWTPYGMLCVSFGKNIKPIGFIIECIIGLIFVILFELSF
jgi:hypothetical protein